jgi:hypothetical protein
VVDSLLSLCAVLGIPLAFGLVAWSRERQAREMFVGRLSPEGLERLRRFEATGKPWRRLRDIDANSA